MTGTRTVVVVARGGTQVPLSVLGSKDAAPTISVGVSPLETDLIG